MFNAQTIHLQGTALANPSTVLLSPWFPRGGDYGIFTVEVEKMSDTTAGFSLKVELLHKNVVDTGNGVLVANSAITVPGNVVSPSRSFKDIVAGFKELVRYQFTLTTTASPPATTSLWATFRMLSPVWYDRV